MRLAFFALTLMVPQPLAAQIVPEPGVPDPRIQTARWVAGKPIELTAMPGTALTVMFEPGETVLAVAADGEAIDTRTSHAGDSLLLYPLREGDLGLVRVETAQRAYLFSLRTGTGLLAAYLVRLTAQAPNASPAPPPPPPTGEAWSYRLRGDRSVRPEAILDDGARTTIRFAPDTPLPAIFAIGAAGDEEVVNGYMRGGAFVIDRVWQELVFRIDGEKASARRNPRPDTSDG